MHRLLDILVDALCIVQFANFYLAFSAWFEVSLGSAIVFELLSESNLTCIV